MSDLDWARERVRRLLAAGPPERLVLVAVASTNFAAAVDGRSKRLSSDADRALMFAWREVADVLLVGSRTLTVERYGSLVPGGREAWPPIATLSRRGDLDLDRILRAKTPPDLIVYGPARPPGDRAQWRESPADFAAVVADLRARGARTIVCEGGPTVYAHVLPLATDFSLTVAPSLVSDGPALLPAAHARRLRLQDATAVGDHVFVHYAFCSQARKSTTR